MSFVVIPVPLKKIIMDSHCKKISRNLLQILLEGKLTKFEQKVNYIQTSLYKVSMEKNFQLEGFFTTEYTLSYFRAILSLYNLVDLVMAQRENSIVFLRVIKL